MSSPRPERGGPERRERMREIVEKFRQKGAVSPEKAMTLDELELPSVFEDLMGRWLHRSGIIVEVKGKYYLSEEGLKEQRERAAARRRQRQHS